MAKEFKVEFEDEYVEINELIAAYIQEIIDSSDEGERRMLTDELEILQRIRRDNYKKVNEADEFERKLKIWKTVLEVVGIVLPVVMTGVGLYVSRKNLIDLLQYELNGSVTSLSGKVLIPKALKV